ncbi:hypothetical protein [Tateyamaria omphalii]|uniref:Outer membrane protein beta-barrel domain-containing protein n=1 Tax=Tateyamaria omphalii TaxID=299262 RepID=A0A1P8N095_9RHOB|nr:hypothetical protein [Tateyamaria omphalii]APX13579.1 hypothetical protein BWR18_19225 [Tateyamaria omphalii]
MPFFLLSIFGAWPAGAGAWMREHGTGFLSYSGVYQETGKLDGSVYLEYGLRPKLTLGAKVDMDMTYGRAGNGTGFLFLRKPILIKEREYKIAYELGIGSTFGDNSESLLRTVLSYGRGIKAWDRYGWLAIDGTVEWALGDGPDTLKLDTTFGLTLNDRFKVMMQMFVSDTDGETGPTLAPSIIWQPRPKAPSFVVGIEGKDGVLALKLGMWRSF